MDGRLLVKRHNSSITRLTIYTWIAYRGYTIVHEMGGDTTLFSPTGGIMGVWDESFHATSGMSNAVQVLSGIFHKPFKNYYWEKARFVPYRDGMSGSDNFGVYDTAKNYRVLTHIGEYWEAKEEAVRMNEEVPSGE